MRSIAVIIDGVWQQPQVNNDDHAINARNNSYVIDPSRNEVDQIVAHLSQVIRLAQSLSEPDQRRVRDFVRAAQAMLDATTSLPQSDQKIFETALRNLVARK